VLQEEFSFRFLLQARGSKEGCDRSTEVETVHSRQEANSSEENERIWQKSKL